MWVLVPTQEQDENGPEQGGNKCSEKWEIKQKSTIFKEMGNNFKESL